MTLGRRPVRALAGFKAGGLASKEQEGRAGRRSETGPARRHGGARWARALGVDDRPETQFDADGERVVLRKAALDDAADVLRGLAAASRSKELRAILKADIALLEKRAPAHWWARCEHPGNCGWESPCYPTRAAAVGAAGQHMRKHVRDGMAPGVRASTRVRSHDSPNVRGVCLGEGAPA